MKLYKQSDEVILQPSMEQFNEYCQTASVISAESLSYYYYKIKDTFSNVLSTLVHSYNDKIVKDVLSNKYSAEHAIKRLKFVDVKDFIVIKPENFKGKYVDYVDDLILVSTELVTNTEFTLNNLKIAISTFINEYNDSKVNSLYGNTYFKEASSITKKSINKISTYFPKPNKGVKAPIEDLLKSLNDIPSIYSSIETLDKILNQDKLNSINKLAIEAAELVDVLIEQSNSSSLVNNSSTKTELVNSLYISAKEIEAVAYLYSNAVFFYSSFNELTKFLISKNK